ncbi:ABC transporter ATP-binding protein [Paenibacillus sp. YYML68]|uniref:ABC transporter ATP-binding protein n=1 Tax=Paenibacillus sp. YYML68 TaxID=2909250 RepID=UPI0024927BB4|nr:ABC transporter ATP-binding protein [Paenibacillus sp. YYML68]
MSELQFDHIRLTYGRDRTVIDDVSLRVAEGEFVALVGRSGCGKTTLLKLAAGLLQPDSGRVLLAGQQVHKPQGDVGIVFQSPTLLEWLTVEDNVLLPLSLGGKVTKADRQLARDYLSRMGLADYAQSYPRQLSGGQQSRVAIARALIREPSLLLMDEPFAALDALTRESLQADLLKLCASRRMTVVFITHDIQEAVFLSNRVVLLQAGVIEREFAVTLPSLDRRDVQLRYAPQFNQLCLAIRQAMEGGGVLETT